MLTCDRCGKPAAQTGTRWTHKDGRELVLCLDHTAEHGPAMRKQEKWTEGPVVPPATAAGEPVNDWCGLCKKPTKSRPVRTSPEHPWVTVLVCPRCDSRECGATTPFDTKCKHKVTDPEATHCPSGHKLMVVKP